MSKESRPSHSPAKEDPMKHGPANEGQAEAVDAATSLALKIRDDSRELIEEQLSSWRASAEATIREKPLQAVGMAVGIGCFLGLLMSRR